MTRVVIIGAGAAGAMAAIFAARAGADTLLLERTSDGGRKILISGGGRCNVLPARIDERRFVSDSSANTLRKIVRSWPLPEQIRFFEHELGIALAEETETAKLFPVSNRARDVRDRLFAFAREQGARIFTNTRVTSIARQNGGWRVATEQAQSFESDALIVATGGLSVPNTGSDGAGLRMLQQLGHTINPTYAALTPITAEPPPFAALAGISLPVTITAQSATLAAQASGGFLFTHRGYSGPAALDVSHVVVRARIAQIPESARVQVRWTSHDEASWETLLRPHGARTVGAAVRAELPDRLALVLLQEAAVQPTRLLADLTREERRRIIAVLVRFELPWTGDEGYKKAEVTGGGVALSEIDPRTMESRLQPGLFLCGEVLDAFGPIGGYNFLWAWATGRAAGQHAGSK